MRLSTISQRSFARLVKPRVYKGAQNKLNPKQEDAEEIDTPEELLRFMQ